MKKILILLTATIFLISTGSSIFARDVEDFWELDFRSNNQGMNIIRIQREDADNRLNLTHKQKHKIRQLRKKARSKANTIFDKKMVLYQEIMQMKEEETLDKDIRAKKVKLQKLNKYSYRIREKYSREIESMLSSEQRAELAKIKQEMRQKEGGTGSVF